MDTIGITISHEQNEYTQIKFSASDWEVNIGESISLKADKVEKITVSKGRLIVLPAIPGDSSAFAPTIHIHFADLDLDFSVQFMEVDSEGRKSFRLSLFWKSIGAKILGAHGIVGESLT